MPPTPLCSSTTQEKNCQAEWPDSDPMPRALGGLTALLPRCGVDAEAVRGDGVGGAHGGGCGVRGPSDSAALRGRALNLHVLFPSVSPTADDCRRILHEPKYFKRVKLGCLGDYFHIESFCCDLAGWSRDCSRGRLLGT